MKWYLKRHILVFLWIWTPIYSFIIRQYLLSETVSRTFFLRSKVEGGNIRVRVGGGLQFFEGVVVYVFYGTWWNRATGRVIRGMGCVYVFKSVFNGAWRYRATGRIIRGIGCVCVFDSDFIGIWKCRATGRFIWGAVGRTNKVMSTVEVLPSGSRATWMAICRAWVQSGNRTEVEVTNIVGGGLQVVLDDANPFWSWRISGLL